MKKSTQEIKEMLEEYALLPDGYDRTNHWIRRFFRCYIDGSYTGSGFYEDNVTFLNGLDLGKNSHAKRLTSRTRQYFSEFLQVEFPDLSRQTIVKTIIDTLSEEQNKRLTNELKEDFLGLIER